MRVISDIAYGKLMDAVDPTGGAALHPALSAWRMFRAGRHADVIFTNEGKRTPPGLILLAAMLWATGQHKLVLSEFLPGARTGVKGAFVTAAYRLLLPHVVAAAQVMTAWEGDEYAARYRIPRERLHLIPFYYYDDRLVSEPMPWTPEGRSGYLATGKNACDWDTLLSAADDQGWPLTIVSRSSEREAIAETARRVGADALADIPRAQHDQMLADAVLLIVALKEKAVSAGHVRLMSAATFGTPVILTAIRGVEGYEHLAAATVPPGDPTALRDAVSALVANPDIIFRRMGEVRARAAERPFSTYADEIRALVRGAA